MLIENVGTTRLHCVITQKIQSIFTAENIVHKFRELSYEFRSDYSDHVYVFTSS
jgi:hypothetical protein